MKTPEEILTANCPVFSSLFHDKQNKASVLMKESILKSMEEYAIQCVETASHSLDRLLEVAESKVEELQSDVNDMESLVEELETKIQFLEPYKERYNEIKGLQDVFKTKLDNTESQLNELRNLPEEEKIYVSTDSPDNVYAAFTDRYRADLDCDEAGVAWCAVTLYRGPRKI